MIQVVKEDIILARTEYDFEDEGVLKPADIRASNSVIATVSVSLSDLLAELLTYATNDEE